ncbi:MAG: hypothetical protein RQ758_05135 [Methanomicrobiaceae archaeon]|nr:hypothetical protein [Methanomicrobiaceae archaeon]
MAQIRYYRIFDIGRDIDLDRLEAALAERHATSRAGFLRIKPKSIMMESPPLQLRLGPVAITAGEGSVEMETVARIFDVGVISLCFITGNLSSESMNEIGFLFAGQEGLAGYFNEKLGAVHQILAPHLPGITINTAFFEDYTIFVTDRPGEIGDPSMLLLGEREPVSFAMREETLRYSLSYREDDHVILSWDAALLANPEPPTDLLDLIEYANVQVFELRYYDRELSFQMEKMYGDMEQADRMTRFRRMRRYHVIMAEIMEIYAEISEIIERVNNLIKVTEDVYYARVYATALTVFRSDPWSKSVTKKIEVLRDNYSMLSDEVRIQHSYFLEWVIIVLIALELSFAIWEYLVI